MADKKVLAKRKLLEQKKAQNEFVIEEKIPVTPSVEIFIRVNDSVAEDSTDIRDLLLASRQIKDPEQVNKLTPEVVQIINRIRANEGKLKESLDDLPEWMRGGLKGIMYNALEDAQYRVKRHFDLQQKLAFTQALLVALVKNAIIIIDGEETDQRFYSHRNISGVTFVEINPIFECQIPSDYFDDTAKNIERAKENQPNLPVRNVRTVAEQQVAWLDAFQEKYPLTATRLNRIFEDSIDKLAYFAYGESVQTDDAGFQPSGLDNSVEEPTTAENEAGL